MEKIWADPHGPSYFARSNFNVPFRQGVKCGNLIYVGGQVAMDEDGASLFPGDMVAQTRPMMENMQSVLALFGATMDDVVNMNTYYVGSVGWKESAQIQSEYFHDGLTHTGVAVKSLVAPDMMIENEAIAVVDTPRSYADPAGLHTPPGGGPFRHGVRFGNVIYVAGQVAMDEQGNVLYAGDLRRQTPVVMDNIKSVLAEFGATMDDVVNTRTFYVGLDGWREAAEIRGKYFSDGPTSTGVVVPSLIQPGLRVQVEAIAMVDSPKKYADPLGHYPWVVNVPFHWGVKVGNMIYVTGQVAMDEQGNVLYAGDLRMQTPVVMDNIKSVLAEFGATMDDVVRKQTYYVTLDGLKDCVEIRGRYFTNGPTVRGVAVDALAVPDLVIEIEAVAIVNG